MSQIAKGRETYPIEHLALSTRTCNALLQYGIRTNTHLHDLHSFVGPEVFLTLTNIGEKGLAEIQAALANDRRAASLRMTYPAGSVSAKFDTPFPLLN